MFSIILILILLFHQLSEISIPHFLTASIFTAQTSTAPLFHRNVRILVVLCIISAICRSTLLLLFPIYFSKSPSNIFVHLQWCARLPFWPRKYDPGQSCFYSLILFHVKSLIACLIASSFAGQANEGKIIFHSSSSGFRNPISLLHK